MDGPLSTALKDFLIKTVISKSPKIWSCGLMHHVLNPEVEGSNLAANKSHQYLPSNSSQARSHRLLTKKERESEMESGDSIRTINFMRHRVLNYI